jgi:hypothetical protein
MRYSTAPTSRDRFDQQRKWKWIERLSGLRRRAANLGTSVRQSEDSGLIL